MAKVVRWTLRGIRAYDAQLEFRSQSFTDKELNNLQGQVDAQIDQLTRFPDRGIASKQMKTVRRITVGKYLQVFYRTHGNFLYIIYFSDSRQRPGGNPYL